MCTGAVHNFIAHPDDARFEALALEVFAYQYRAVGAFGSWCDRSGRTPATVHAWQEIPAVPTRAFKSVALHAAPPKVVFRSSGTSQGNRRSEHHHPFPNLYRSAIEHSFPGFCLPSWPHPVPMLSLIPSLEQVPDSSLSFMVDHVMSRFGGAGSRGAVGLRGVELPTVRSWLGARQRDGRASLLLATSLSLLQCIEGLERLGLRFRLPPGSAIFETGGTKTRSSEIDLEDLHARLQDRLGIGHDRIVHEYGLTELTSQAYGGALVGREPDLFLCPPWMKVRIVDPETLDEMDSGGTGLVAILDLANVGSTIHVLTEDLGTATAEGFRLAGRASGAELRGCSLTAEELGRSPA